MLRGADVLDTHESIEAVVLEEVGVEPLVDRLPAHPPLSGIRFNGQVCTAVRALPFMTTAIIGGATVLHQRALRSQAYTLRL